MKQSVMSMLSLFVVLTTSGASNAAPVTSHELRNLSVPFVANQGQTDGRVRFYANTFGGTAYVTGSGEIVYDLPRSPQHAVLGWSLKEGLIGAGIRSVEGEERTATNVSYFLGRDSTRWKSDIAAYGLVSMGEVYRGIRFKLKAHGSSVEKLFYVDAGAQPSDIHVKLTGATSLQTNDQGELEVGTGLGTVIFTKPAAYQMRDGRTERVDVAYAIDGTSYGFALGPYDRTRELVIDPVIQVTYLGGTGNDFASAIAVSGQTVYVAGGTTSTDFPGTVGGAQPTIAALSDAYVALLTADLRDLIQTTYFGGTGDDAPTAIAVVGNNVYVAGSTTSTDFPKTTGGAQDTFGGAGALYGTDGFVALLSADLKTLTQATYLGGSDDDRLAAMVVPANSLGGYNVFVAGTTTSSNFPGTTGGAQPTGAGLQSVSGGLFDEDGFVAALTYDLKSLTQATYLGGSSFDEVHAIALSPEGGLVYVAGETQSQRDFPRVAGGAQETFGGLLYDGFVSLLTSDLTTLLQSTYYGGSDTDAAWALAVSADGVYVAGETASTDLVGTIGRAQPLLAGYFDGFVALLNSSLTHLTHATYLGGKAGVFPLDRILAIALSYSGVYVAGVTGSTDFPGVVGAQEDFGGDFDGFVAVLTPDLQWRTFLISEDGTAIAIAGTSYLGGSGNDAADAVAVTPTEVYVAGSASSTDFPGTAGGAQPDNAGGSGDAFVAKLVLVQDYSLSPISPLEIAPGGSGIATVTLNSLYGFQGTNVKMFVSGQPDTIAPLAAGFTASFGAPGSQLDPPYGGSISTPVTIDVASFVTPDTYTLWLVALPGTPITHSARIVIDVGATFTSLSALIGSLNAAGCINNAGISRALMGEISLAQASSKAGRNRVAIDVLNAFSNQVRAQEGKHISTSCMLGSITVDPAAVLISDAQDVVDDLTAGSGPGEKCHKRSARWCHRRSERFS